MINDNQLKSLIKKLKRNAERKQENKKDSQKKINVSESSVDTYDADAENLFKEMKKREF